MNDTQKRGTQLCQESLSPRNREDPWDSSRSPRHSAKNPTRRPSEPRKKMSSCGPGHPRQLCHGSDKKHPHQVGWRGWAVDQASGVSQTRAGSAKGQLPPDPDTTPKDRLFREASEQTRPWRPPSPGGHLSETALEAEGRSDGTCFPGATEGAGKVRPCPLVWAPHPWSGPGPLVRPRP